MPEPRLDLTLAATLAGAQPEDLRVHDVRRPNVGEPTDAVYIDISPRSWSRPLAAGMGWSICFRRTAPGCIWAIPRGLNWGQRRVKNDERDAIDLADMLRLGRRPEAWIAPPATRELRELVRYRAKLGGQLHDPG
jgi:hypothetical protein